MDGFDTTGMAATIAGGKITSNTIIAGYQRRWLYASAASQIISRLNGIKKTGYSRWIAKCPAHDDRSPSLTIRELDDGRVLVHCFSGCDVSAVVGAVGLTLSDLFPPREFANTKPKLASFNALDVLKALRHESLVIAIAAAQIVNGKPLSEEDAARVAVAYQRINEAIRLAGGDHVR